MIRDISIRQIRWPRIALALLVIAFCRSAWAHNGPPFPIIENRKLGPYTVAVWTHPDVGTGTFFVLVDPPTGGKIPGDLKVAIGVQPVSGRLPEKLYIAQRGDSRGTPQYNAAVDFDRQEFWKVHVLLQSAAGGGETYSQVEATPVGFGRWDLLFYLSPFALVVVLWFRGMSRVRRLRNKRAAQPSGQPRSDARSRLAEKNCL